jgi:hypothetical protein
MSEELQAQFKTEGQPAFEPENTEKDNSASSPEGEKTDTEQTQSQEGETNSGAKKDDGDKKDGFQYHPAWKEREKKWDSRFNEQEERHVNELQSLRTEFEEKLTSRITPPESNLPEDIPAWFGGDESQWKQYKSYHQTMINNAKEAARNETLKEIENRTSGEQKAIDDATKYFRSEVESLEETTGEKIDRNKLLKFVLDNELVDTKGRWNYKAGYRLMKAEVAKPKTDALNEKKKLANGTVEGNKSESKPAEFMTNEDFQKPGNRPW